MLILFLCIIIFLIIWLVGSKRKNRQAFRRQEEKYQKDVTSFQQQEAQFQSFYNDIEDARQEKKDTVFVPALMKVTSVCRKRRRMDICLPPLTR